MPRLDGIEATRLILGDPEAPPVRVMMLKHSTSMAMYSTLFGQARAVSF